MRHVLALLVLVLLTAGLPGLPLTGGHPLKDATVLAATPSPAAGIKGKTYTSPQFGYIVTWDSPWVSDGATSDPEAGDHLRLSTGAVALEYHGVSTDQPLAQAHESFVAARARTHPGAIPQYQDPGGGPNADSPALWHFTYTRADGVVIGEATTAYSVASGRGVLMRTSIRPTTDASPRSLYYAVALFLDPMEATAVAQHATQEARARESVPTAGANDLQTLSGTVRLTDSFVVASDGTCIGAGPFRDVGPGLPISVANVVDVPIVTGYVTGRGTLVASRSGSGQDCLFTFSIANVPTQPFYRISVGQYIERKVFDQATLDAKNWSIDFVL